MPDADYIYDCELALWPAVAGLYPDAVFGEIYDWVEESIFDEWTEAEFSKAAMAVELERLHTGSDEQFLGIFQRLRKVHSADVEPVSEKGLESETSRLARKNLLHINGRETTIGIHCNDVVPPHQLECHDEEVARAILYRSLRERVSALRDYKLVHHETYWALYLTEEHGGPFATELYSELVGTAARLMPEEWSALLVTVDDHTASQLSELVATRTDKNPRGVSFQAVPEAHYTSSSLMQDQEDDQDSENDNKEGRKVQDNSAQKDSKRDTGSNVTTRMVEMTRRRAKLFNDGNSGYVAARVKDHRECHPIRSTGFRNWLTTEIYATEGKIPSGTTISDASNTIEGLALAEGKCTKPAIRVAGTLDEIFIDLGDAEWRCVKVTSEGWSVMAHPKDVFFIRPADFGELPEPQRGKDLELLERFLNLPEQSLRLCQAYLLMVCQPQGPYPQLVSCGEPGATKSSLQKVVKALTDPTRRPANSPAPVSLARRPTRSGDLFVVGANSHLVTADNLSSISDELSDEFCCLATGDSWKTRKYYTNFGEASIDVCRPALLNGISNPIRRSDHGERSILLETYKPKKVIDEEDYWKAFEEEWPFLLGALYDALAVAMKFRYAVALRYPPRMVGFVRLGTAAAQGLKWDVNFLEIYQENQRSIMADITDGEPILAQIVDFARQQREWRGSPSELLREIKQAAGLVEFTTDKRGWPESGKAMAEVLKRNRSVLKQEGITWDLAPTNRRRIVLRANAPSVSEQVSQAV